MKWGAVSASPCHTDQILCIWKRNVAHIWGIGAKIVQSLFVCVLTDLYLLPVGARYKRLMTRMRSFAGRLDAAVSFLQQCCEASRKHRHCRQHRNVKLYFHTVSINKNGRVVGSRTSSLVFFVFSVTLFAESQFVDLVLIRRLILTWS